jgi:hypothetical protein
MTVLPEQSGRQNSAYRSGCQLDFAAKHVGRVPHLSRGSKGGIPRDSTSWDFDLFSRVPSVLVLVEDSVASGTQLLKQPARFKVYIH